MSTAEKTYRGSFTMEAEWSDPDITIDNTFAPARRDATRYERHEGRDGRITLDVKIDRGVDMAEAVRVACEALEQAGFCAAFGQ